MEPPPSQEAATIPLRHLSGHRAAINALHANEAGLLVSASDDGTARVWDVKGARSLRMASVSSSINSVLFGPRDQLYLAVGSELVVFDLRKPEVIMRTFESRRSACEEEINQLSLNTNNSLLALADDSGNVTVLEPAKDFAVYSKFANTQEKAICTTVQFSPVQRTILFAGGFDAHIRSWDVAKRQQVAALSCSVPSAQLVNPAFVHRISISSDGSFVAAALGDSTTLLANTQSLSPLMRLDDIAGHKSAVSQVVFPAFSPRNHLLTASDDCRIILWNVQRQAKKGSQSSASRVLLKIAHTHKANWIETSAAHSNTLFVADSSNNISLYTIPLP